jgi:hypothetical protein
MKLIISEKQLQQLVKLHAKSQELSEEGEEGAPESGTSSDGEKKTGMPHWESGINRGPANQIAVTRWKDVEGTQPTRGKANTLWEQETAFTRQLDRQYSTYAGAQKANADNKKLVNDIINMDPHTRNTILGIAAGLATGGLGWIGIGVAAGFGLYDAKLYYDEGDMKSAGLSAMFAIIPGVGTLLNKIPGVKQLGTKGMTLLADKLSKGLKITNPQEITVLNGIARNKMLVQTELKKTAEEISIKAARLAAEKKLKQQAIKKVTTNTAKKTGKVVGNIAKDLAVYGAAGYGYNKVYDKLVQPQDDLSNRLFNSKIKPTIRKDDEFELVNGIYVPKRK